MVDEIREDEIQEPTPEVKEVDGVKYTLDTEGNHCIGNAKVLDDKGVPFYNRTREFERKAGETKIQHDERIADLETRHQEEIVRLQHHPQATHNPDDIDPETDLPYKAVAVIEKRVRASIQGDLDTDRSRNQNASADNNIATEIAGLKIDPEYKGFFANKQYVDELNQELRGLTLDSALKGGIVKVALERVLGKNIKTVVKAAEERGRKAAIEGREIDREITLVEPAGPSGKAVAGETPALRKEADEKRVTVATLLEIKAHEKKLEKENKGGD